MLGTSWNSWPRPWPQKSRTTEQPLALGIDLDGVTDIAGAGARDGRRDSAHQAFIGDLHQARRLARHRADREHPAQIAMPAIDDQGDIDIDDVALAQQLVIGMPWRTTWLIEVQMERG